MESPAPARTLDSHAHAHAGDGPGQGAFKELRDEVRHAVDRMPLGEVCLKDRKHLQPVHAIRDLSGRGVSLCIDDALAPGEPVVIELQRGEFHMSFYAYVAWCCPGEQLLGEAAQLLPGTHVAGLRVVGAQSLGQLIGLTHGGGIKRRNPVRPLSEPAEGFATRAAGLGQR
ncbi:MAG: PilZ domain-containing protein [Burkholderiales bacterium]